MTKIKNINFHLDLLKSEHNKYFMWYLTLSWIFHDRINMKKLWMVKIIFHLDLPKPNIINVSCDIGEQIRELNITHLIYIEEMLSIIQIPLNALESTKTSTKWDLCFFMAYHVFKRITWHCYIIKASLMINFKTQFFLYELFSLYLPRRSQTWDAPPPLYR